MFEVPPKPRKDFNDAERRATIRPPPYHDFNPIVAKVFRESIISPRGPLPGLVVAGSATHGAGVEAAVISGAYAANALVPGLLARPAVQTPRNMPRAALPVAAA